MGYNDIKNFRQRLKERAVYVLGGKCQCCGYDKCIQALDFHHLNPSEKDFNFNDNANRSWKATREEIKKCILVCSNCHREIHSGLINNNLLVSSFNEDRAKEIDDLVDKIKHRQMYYCRYCGKEVTRGNDVRPECYHFMSRKIERPSREEFKNLIRNNSFVSVGKMFGVSDAAIRKWCDSYKLPRKVSDIKKISDKDWENI